MKALPIIACLLLLTSCGGITKYAAEDELYACWQEYAKEKGYDLDQGIYELERVFIDHSLLGGRTGEDYLQYCELFLNYDAFDSLTTPAFVEHMRGALEAFPFNLKCNSPALMDSTFVQNSNLHKLTAVFDKIEEMGDLSPQVIGTALADIYSAEDLNHKVYQHSVLSMTILFGIRTESASWPPAGKSD